MNLNTSLLREKFIITESDTGNGEKPLKLEVRSNRMALPLKSGNMEPEEFVVRAHNMHSCIRMAAQIVNSCEHTGPIANRNPPYDWEEAWHAVVGDYERAHNPHRWIAVYYKGRLVYESEAHHGFLDVIEKCDALNGDAYEKSIALAEDAFKKAGKDVEIEYMSNIALVVDIEKLKGRCGMILRGPDRTTTFNMVMEAHKPGERIVAAQCLTAAAAFLEGIQLAYMVGINLEKTSKGLIPHLSPEDHKTRDARRRLGRLNAKITTLENNARVRYRPERPDFFEIVQIAERLAQKTLKTSEEAFQHSYEDE